MNLSAATKYAPAWKTAYSEFLNSKKGKFSLIYLNDDNIPEIAFTSGSAHANGVYIYAYIDGAVKPITWEGIDKLGTYGSITYKERGNLIALNNGGNRTAFINYIISVNGNTALTEHTFEWNMRSNKYTWNGGSVSADTYNNEWERMTSDYKTVDHATNTTISSANIKSALDM